MRRLRWSLILIAALGLTTPSHAASRSWDGEGFWARLLAILDATGPEADRSRFGQELWGIWARHGLAVDPDGNPFNGATSGPGTTPVPPPPEDR